MTGLELNQRMEQGTAVLYLFQQLTRNHYMPLPAYIAGILAQDSVGVILDLHAVDFVDSTGISILLNSKKAADAAGKPLVLCNVSSYFKDIIDTLNLTQIFTIRDTLEHALRACREQP